MEKQLTKMERAWAWVKKKATEGVKWTWNTMPVVLAVSLVESIVYTLLISLKYAFWGIRAVIYWLYIEAWSISNFFGRASDKLEIHIDDRLRSKIKK